MAETNAPPPNILEEIALQVRERLVVSDEDANVVFSFNSLNERGSPETSALDMSVTFELWKITPAAVDRLDEGHGDLARLATRTGRLHHQITFNDGAAAFARSDYSEKDDGGPGWSVDEIYVSPLAAAFDAAIDRAEEEFPGDDLLARLLTAPAYQVEALWFVDRADAERGVESGGELLVVTAPADHSTLRPLQRIGAADFLKALRVAPVGMGINAGPRRA